MPDISLGNNGRCNRARIRVALLTGSTWMAVGLACTERAQFVGLQKDYRAPFDTNQAAALKAGEQPTASCYFTGRAAVIRNCG